MDADELAQIEAMLLAAIAEAKAVDTRLRCEHRPEPRVSAAPDG